MSIECFLRSLCVGFLLLCAVIFPLAGPANSADGADAQTRWVASWAASQQLVEPNNSLAPADIRDVTLRQIVHLSLGGTQIRLRLSNRFGSTPLHLTAVHVARAVSPASDKIAPATDRALTFLGSSDVTIPPHADYLSDPVSFAVNALSDVAITLHTDIPPDDQTGHPGSRATSYFTHGDVVSALELSGAKTTEHWYFIAGIDVAVPQEANAVVILGDSITDGHGATTNGNDRWTDVLAQRLQSQPGSRSIAVLNQGIGGNHLLTDGLGPNALSRFDHDVLAQPGARYLIVLEGINDIGSLARKGEVAAAEHESLVRRIIGAYEQIVARAHTHDIKTIGATIMPFVGSSYYHPGMTNEADRQAVNAWIRTPGHFDAVLDFDKITLDPEHPERLLPLFDSGDHLHPSPPGFAAMAQAVPLSLFVNFSEPPPKMAIACPPTQIGTDIPSVFETLAGFFPVGAAIWQGDVTGPHSELLKKHFNSITAENDMKWSSLRPSEAAFDFAKADMLVAFARANHMRVRGHTLVWHKQNPEWLFKDGDGKDLQPSPESKALLLQRLEKHIRGVVGHFKDDVYAWDVVNEVIDPDQPDGFRRTPWFLLTGTAYIDTAFRIAHEVAPNAKLFINEYSTTKPGKRAFLLSLVRDLKARGVPIDGVGHQMHIHLAEPPVAEITETIQLFSSLGLENQITELDVSLYANPTDRSSSISEAQLIEQGYRYRDIFQNLRLLKGHISGVTFWGLADDHTWLKSFPIERLDLPLLFDEHLQPKPAYWGVIAPCLLPPRPQNSPLAHPGGAPFNFPDLHLDAQGASK